MAVTEVYWWDMSGATMDHDRDSGTVQDVSLDMRPNTPMIHQGRSTKNPSKLDSLLTGNPLMPLYPLSNPSIFWEWARITHPSRASGC